MTISTGLQSFVIAKALVKRRGDLETYGWSEREERRGKERQKEDEMKAGENQRWKKQTSARKTAYTSGVRPHTLLP